LPKFFIVAVQVGYSADDVDIYQTTDALYNNPNFDKPNHYWSRRTSYGERDVDEFINQPKRTFSLMRRLIFFVEDGSRGRIFVPTPVGDKLLPTQ